MSNFAFVPVPTKWQGLPRHEFSEDMGDMTEAEFAMLCTDMEQNGFQGRAVLLTGNKTFEVADGWHQLRAAVVTGKVPSFERYVGSDLFGEIWRRHGPRKHWNESQRSMIAAKVANRTRGNYSKAANLPVSPTQESAAKTVNVSERSVRDAVKVIEDGTPALQQAVMNGTVSVSDAVKIVDEPAKVQNAAVKAVKKGRAKTAKAAVAATEPTPPKSTEIPKDSDGTPYPAPSLPAVQNVSRLTQLERHLREGIELAQQIGNEPIGLYLDPSGITARLTEAKSLVLAAHPKHVCKNCAGEDKKCKWCKGQGWQTRGGYKQCPEPGK